MRSKYHITSGACPSESVDDHENASYVLTGRALSAADDSEAIPKHSPRALTWGRRLRPQRDHVGAFN